MSQAPQAPCRYGQASPCFMAMMAALVRLGAPSLARMLPHVQPDGADAEDESLRDLVVAEAGGEQPEDLPLARREVAADGVAVEDRLHRLAVDGPAAVVGVPDRLHQPLGLRVLEQVADRPRVQRPLDQLFVDEARERDDLDAPDTPP